MNTHQAIQIWRATEAPEEYTMLMDNVDWVALVPPSFLQFEAKCYLPKPDEFHWFEHPYMDGWNVAVGTHY